MMHMLQMLYLSPGMTSFDNGKMTPVTWHGNNQGIPCCICLEPAAVMQQFRMQMTCNVDLEDVVRLSSAYKHI